MPSLQSWRIATAVAARDLRIEARTREALLAMGFYAVLVMVIFSFAFAGDASLTGLAGGGLLWVALLFAALVALDRSFLREAAESSWTGLLISPAPRTALLAGKFASSFVLLLGLEAILVPLFAVLFNAPRSANWGGIVVTVLLGTWALAANGTYFAAMSAHARQRGLLLPLSIPAILAMVEATQSYLAAEGMANYWLRLLVGYNVIFTALGALLADTVLEVE